MNFRARYSVIEEAIPERNCDEIINYFSNKEKIKGTVRSSEKKKQNWRNSYVSFDDSSVWINNLINPFIREANKKFWNLQIDYPETNQFTEYKLNQYYHWHMDALNGPHDRPMDKKLHNKIRKISSSLFLSNPEDYEGGSFNFCYLDDKARKKTDTIKKLKKGSLVIFLSNLLHEIKPVTKGTRYSLVNWYIGNKLL
jgi:PKHD-type hydroxylase